MIMILCSVNVLTFSITEAHLVVIIFCGANSDYCDCRTSPLPRMEAKVIAIPHENRYRLQTEYGVLTNTYPTSELNLVPAELLDFVRTRLATSKNLPLTLHFVLLRH